jgi:hypothetical protein
MLFFPGISRRLSSKSKETSDQQILGIKSVSTDTNHDGVKSIPPNEEELSMQVSHLQSEMSRLNLQLASMQARSLTDQGKEEHSTQRSNRTFSTKATTQPNTTPGSLPRYVLHAKSIMYISRLSALILHAH